MGSLERESGDCDRGFQWDRSSDRRAIGRRRRDCGGELRYECGESASKS